MYKIDRRGGGPKNRSLRQTPPLFFSISILGIFCPLATELGPLACLSRSAQPRNCLILNNILNYLHTGSFLRTVFRRPPPPFLTILFLTNYFQKNYYLFCVKLELRQFLGLVPQLGQARGPGAAATLLNRDILQQLLAIFSENQNQLKVLIGPLRGVWVRISQVSFS